MNRVFLSILLLLSSAGLLQAQDIVTRKNGDYLRGIIKGCDAYTVLIEDEKGTEKLLKVKDVKDFFWNGDTYVSKTFFDAKKPEERFARVLETGAINLYAIGGSPASQPVQRSAVRARPSIGLGMGSGGMGGGLGGSISFGGGRSAGDERPQQAAKTWYYIERPGKNGVQPIPLAIVTPETSKRAVKDILLFNLGDDAELAAQVNASADFNRKEVQALIKAYNLKHGASRP
ncbi:hypothetical protein C7T94_03445 [Pedobacter yulinensis]|uniref:DUF4369 domain-containing protein n=1 Tax=Pedobacter yulinensis TaxID=2126353 RepID=A0A2T3HRZ4_9SPHI|nr:hypothetical protein [Pedobacter yulinensis]PST85173.1 hypothetical protein C7T94_03445 [Pedobacter yulinensis]